MKKFNNKIEQIRLFLIKFLLKDSEKYLLQMSLEDREYKLKGLYREKSVDTFNLNEDINEVKKLKNLFSTEYYK